MRLFVNRYYPVFINVYTVWMLYMLFFAAMRELHHREFELRTTPFETISFYYYHLSKFNNKIEFEKNIIGNIVIFIPYGFLGILYPKLKNSFFLILTFFIVINIIEFSQYYFKRGTADVDDIILNTSGVIIGFIIYKKFFFTADR